MRAPSHGRCQQRDAESFWEEHYRNRRAEPGRANPVLVEAAEALRVLDYLRSSVAGKAANVPEPRVRTGGVPSGTNLLGLIKHLTRVERFYFLGEPINTMRRTMQPTREETVDGRLRRYYRLTEPGASALAAEAEQRRRDARMVFQRLRGTGPAGAPSPA